MRTTLTLDDDIAFRVRELQSKDPAKSFKQIINELLERGLRAKPSGRKAEFVLTSYPIGLRKDLNFDNIEEVLDVLEGVNRR